MVKYVPHGKARVVRLGPGCRLDEYGTFGGDVVGVVTALIKNGRYPQQGWAVNHECDELVFVLGGTGALEMPGEEITLEKRDTVFIPKGQKFAWRGRRLELLLLSVPAWSAKQYTIFE